MIIVKQINTDNSGIKIRRYAESVAGSLYFLDKIGLRVERQLPRVFVAFKQNEIVHHVVEESFR